MMDFAAQSFKEAACTDNVRLSGHGRRVGWCSMRETSCRGPLPEGYTVVVLQQEVGRH